MADDKLFEAINQAVVEKTFGLEALKAIDALKTRLRDFEESERRLKSNITRLEAENVKFVSDLQMHIDKAKGADKIIADLQAREGLVAEALFTAKYADLRRADVMDLVRTVFRSPVMSKVISEHEVIPVVIPGSSGCSGYVNRESKDKTTEIKEGEVDPKNGGRL